MKYVNLTAALLALTFPLAAHAAFFPALDISAVTEVVVDLEDDIDPEGADFAAIRHLVDFDTHGHRLYLNSEHAEDERLYVVEVGAHEVDELVQRLQGIAGVEHAEPNHWYTVTQLPPTAWSEPNADGPTAPNDPRYAEQWNMRMVGAEEAWKGSTGTGVVVAVIDTGVAYTDYKKFKQVEDLAGTEFVPGYDFVNDHNRPLDDHGHGTHVAGTIAQTTNNGVGVAGLAYGAKIMPLKVLSAYGSGTTADIADAIRFAADEGAQVINMSLGGGGHSNILAKAVKYARDKGVVVACAAGNGGRRKVEYPAAYPGAFAVSSVGPSGKLAFYSSYGPEVQVAAPGGDQSADKTHGVLQNTVTGASVGNPSQYMFFQGTSMATPHVAALAALVFSAGVTNPDEVERIIRESAVPPEGQTGRTDEYGAGVISASAAVQMAKGVGGSWFSFLWTVLVTVVLFIWNNWRRLPLAAVRATTLSWGNLPLVLGGAALATLGMPAAETALTSALDAPTWHFTAVWASAAPVVLVTLFMLGVKSLRPALVGLALGWGMFLVTTAVGALMVDVLWIPGLSSWADRGWLLVNGLVLFFLANRIAAANALAEAEAA